MACDYCSLLSSHFWTGAGRWARLAAFAAWKVARPSHAGSAWIAPLIVSWSWLTEMFARYNFDLKDRHFFCYCLKPSTFAGIWGWESWRFCHRKALMGISLAMSWANSLWAIDWRDDSGSQVDAQMEKSKWQRPWVPFWRKLVEFSPFQHHHSQFCQFGEDLDQLVWPKSPVSSHRAQGPPKDCPKIEGLSSNFHFSRLFKCKEKWPL